MIIQGHSPRSNNPPNGKSSYLGQIAEEDLISASTSVASFHPPTNANSRRNHLLPVLPMTNRALSDQDLFTRVNNEPGHDFTSSSEKPMSYTNYNFESGSKPQLTKGNSLASMSSDSGEVSSHLGDNVQRKNGPTVSPNGSTAASSPAFMNNPTKGKGTFRKQTQNIAARAAQRRANLHHREVMEDMGSVYSSDPVMSNESTVSTFGLDIAGGKPKKTVTINDRANDFHRNNSESPELLKNGKASLFITFNAHLLHL